MAAKVEIQLTMLRSLLEEARSIGADVSKYETAISKLEKSFDESKLKMTELKWLTSSIDTLMGELSGIVERFKHELEKEPTPLEAQVYEYLMKHGGMSISAFSEQRGITKEETRRAIERLVKLDMIEVREV